MAMTLDELKKEEKRVINEWLERWERYFEYDKIDGDKKFWYRIPVHIMSLETEKAQQISVDCYDNNSAKEMDKGEYFTHSFGGKDVSVLMWMPKKVIDFNNRKAPYGIIRKNLLEKYTIVKEN